VRRRRSCQRKNLVFWERAEEGRHGDEGPQRREHW